MTGYTAVLQEGDVSLKQFVLTCARAFGPCIEQRDENSDVPPRKVELDVSYEQSEIERLKNEEYTLTDFEEYVAKQREYYVTTKNKKKVIKKKYQEMLTQVKNWSPPTESHTPLKNFMISQIEDSIEFDCKMKYYDDEQRRLGELTFGEWQSTMIECRDKALRNMNISIEEKTRNVKFQNEWIDKLYASL